MPITLPTLIEKVTPDELEFLEGLLKNFPLEEYVSHRHKMTLQEMKRLLSLLGPERNLTLSPSAWVYGCAYKLAHITTRSSTPKYEILFGAREDLWPEIGNPPPSNYKRFNFLSKWFMKDSNIQLIASTGEEIPINDYSRYDY